VLVPSDDTAALARITLSLGHAPADTLDDPRLEQLRRTIPAARALPLLDAIAHQTGRRVVIDYLDDLQLILDLAA
jgi:hypothetical protein